MYEQKVPRYYFKDGFLWIYGEWEARIRVWPDPLAEERYNKYNFWNDLDPTERLIKPYRKRNAKKDQSDPRQSELGIKVVGKKPHAPTLAEKKKRAYDRLRFSVPKEIVARVEKFHSHQWGPVLMMHHHGQAAMDLLGSNPVLAFVLANSKNYRKMMLNPRTRKVTHTTLALKQRVVCGCLNFPAEQWMVKVFSRVHPASACRDLLLALRPHLEEESVRRQLGHFKVINRSILEILADKELRDGLGPQVLDEISNITRDRYHPYTARKLQELTFMHREIYPDKPFPRFKAVSKYLAYHKEMDENFVRRFGKLKCIAFPPPPVEGTLCIRPITTAAQLQLEGDRQHHCVARFAEQVANKRMYVYQVDFPQRATLSIIPQAGGRWRRCELKCHSNKVPSPKTVQMVDAWLESAGR